MRREPERAKQEGDAWIQLIGTDISHMTDAPRLSRTMQKNSLRWIVSCVLLTTRWRDGTPLSNGHRVVLRWEELVCCAIRMVRLCYCALRFRKTRGRETRTGRQSQPVTSMRADLKTT